MRTKIFIGLLGALFLAGCAEGDKFDYNKRVIIMTGTDSDPLVRLSVNNPPVAYTVTASATDKVTEDVTVTFAHDASLVDAYNMANNTRYYPIPASALRIDGTQGVIKVGQTASSGITVNIVSDTDFEGERIYLVPITITNVVGGGMDVLPASKTLYLRIGRPVGFTSLDIEANSQNANMYSNFIFDDDKAIRMQDYTYEIKCYIRAWHESTSPGYSISRLCSFTSKDETNSNMLRFGEDGNAVNALQWVKPSGNTFSSTRFETGRWYLITLTHKGTKYTMYVDGEKDAEDTGEADVTFQRLEIGMSWAGTYRQRQRFLGRIAEIRVWNRALSSNEIKMGLCGVDPESDGLVAYWKLNEGTGHIFHDATGNGYDMDWTNTWRAPGEGDIEAIDVSQYVNWVTDDNNMCDL